ncbi:MAG: NAD-binding protein [Gammaproteobacteria bacterium]
MNDSINDGLKGATPRIVIVGGGLVGASLACAHAPLGSGVTVVEAVAPRAAEQPSYDDRTLALGAASCEILRGLGLWPGLAASATPIRQVIVSELGRPGRVVLDAAEAGREWFGHVVEARAFGQAVLGRLDELDGVELRCPARVTGLELGEDSVRVTVDGEQGPEQLTPPCWWRRTAPIPPCAACWASAPGRRITARARSSAT